MESFAKLIKTRRSIRKYTEELLKPEEVELLLKAALMSPSSKSRNPWQFVVVEDKAQLALLSKCKPHGAAMIEHAALAIVVVANPMECDVWIEDASIATIFVQLQAEDLGLGSCWVQVRERETAEGTSSEQYVRDLLDIPYHMQVLSIVAVGHKGQDRKPYDESNLQWEKVHLGSFKSSDINLENE